MVDDKKVPNNPFHRDEATDGWGALRITGQSPKNTKDMGKNIRDRFGMNYQGEPGIELPK